MSYRFLVSKTNGDNKYSWWLYGSNGEQVGWAGETFPTEHNARRAAEAFRAGASTARYEVYPDAAGKFRWRATRSSDKVAASGESFDSQWNAQRAADNVKANAPFAVGL